MKDRKPSRRGLLALSFLGVALVGTVAACLMLVNRGEGTPSLSREERMKSARMALGDGDFGRAETLLAPLGEERTSEIDLGLVVGRTLLGLGKLSAARAQYNALHKKFPDRYEVLMGLGEVHERSNELDHAIACYRRASEMAKQSPEAFRALGMAQVKRGDRMGALFSFRQSLRLRTGQEDLSRLLDEIGSSKEAMAGRRPSPAASSPPDPFGDLLPRPNHRMDFDPSRPSPGVPDPLRGLPRPGGIPR